MVDSSGPVHTDLPKTPDGAHSVPINFFQESESDRISYAWNHKWLHGLEGYQHNRPFVAGAHLLSPDSTEFKLMLAGLEHFRSHQPKLEEMLLNVPIRTLNHMCPKRTHRAGVMRAIKFVTTVVFLPESVVEDAAHLVELKKAAWSFLHFLPVLYLCSIDKRVTGTSEYASRHADSATEIAGAGANWVDIIRRNLDMCLKSQARKAAFHRKLRFKASLRNTPGFHSVHLPAVVTTAAGPEPLSPETPEGSRLETFPHAGREESAPSQASLRDQLLAQRESSRHDASTRERVRRLALDPTYSASGNMKVLLSEPRAPRDANALARLHDLTGMPPVLPRIASVRSEVAACAEEVRSSILFRSNEVCASLHAAAKQAAGDLSGWMNVHFQHLCRSVCSPTTQHMTLLLEALARGDPRMLPDQDNRLFCTSILVPITKKRGSSDLRPIAIPNCFMKRAESVLCASVKRSAVSFLNPTVSERAEVDGDGGVDDGDGSGRGGDDAECGVDDDGDSDENGQKITTGTFNKMAQYSFGIPSGASKAANRVKFTIELNPTWVSAQIDMKNAFNSVDTEFMFQTWHEDFVRAPPGSDGYNLRILLPYISRRYSGTQVLKMPFDSHSYMGKHRTEDEIEVQRGTLQGASLSPLLFNIALSKALRYLEERKEDGAFVFEHLFATMFADDVVIQGEPSTVVRALEDMAKRLAPAGLNIKFVKVLPHSGAAEEAYNSAFSQSTLSLQESETTYELLPPLDTSDPEAQVRSGLTYVGVPIGTDRFVMGAVEGIVDEAERSILKLVEFAVKGPSDTSRAASRFHHRSYAMHLFSICGITRFDYLYHHVPPRIMDGLARRIQTLLDDSFAKITGISAPFAAHRHDNICTEAFLRLPARLGGLGVPNVKVVSSVAFLSTLAGTCRSVIDSLPDAWKLRLHASPGEDVVSALSAVQDLAKRAVPSAPPPPPPPSSSTSSPPQRKPPPLEKLIPKDTTQLMSFTLPKFREGVMHHLDEHALKELKREVKSRHDNAVAPYGDAQNGDNFLAFFNSQVDNGLAWRDLRGWIDFGVR